MGEPNDIHAGCVAVGEAGVLLRGSSGSGKSTLALAILDAAAARGTFARLVADDRVVLDARHGRLVARAHPDLEGLLEERCAGVLALPALAAAVVRLVVDLDGAPERLPERTSLALRGIVLPVLALPARAARAETVLRRLGADGIGPVAGSRRSWHGRVTC